MFLLCSYRVKTARLPATSPGRPVRDENRQRADQGCRNQAGSFVLELSRPFSASAKEKTRPQYVGKPPDALGANRVPHRPLFASKPLALPPGGFAFV
jgi:hypothetical protein